MMITAEQFAQTFEHVSQDQMATLLQCWSNQPKFTQCVKHQMMPAIAGALGCSLELEYKRVDIVFRALPDPESQTAADTEVVAAIEHENNCGGAESEVRKLRDLMAPLGVLITYVSLPRRQQLIAEFARIMVAGGVPSDGTSEGELLLIIGPYGMKPPTSLTWEYFMYGAGGFQQLTL